MPNLKPSQSICRSVGRRRLLAAAGIAALGPLGAAAQDTAKDYPSKTITLVVPYAAGGSSDTRARQLGEKLSKILGKPVIVDNKAGGNGNIGTDFIARATPDGHTIGIGNFAPLAVNKALYPKLSYDPKTDLVPVVLIEKGPVVLVVSDKSPYKGLTELLAAAKTTPGKMSYASAGSGGAYHLAGEMFNVATGTSSVHIPYKGGGPATNDLLAGTVEYMFDMVPATLGYIKASPPKMRALALANDKRLPALPDVPTFAELGIKNMEISNWLGIVAPKGTPPAIVNKLNLALNKALQEPDLTQRITSMGNLVGGGSPQDFANFIATESARWSKLIKERAIQGE
jgi:tripartite-type tricarboxylate transporter receptor subunit TctC